VNISSFHGESILIFILLWGDGTVQAYFRRFRILSPPSKWSDPEDGDSRCPKPRQYSLISARCN